MPRKRTHGDLAKWVDLYPLGAEGLDLQTSAALASPDSLVVAENTRMDNVALTRRRGGVKVYQAADPTQAATFGADTIYATVTTAAQLILGAGGFALRFSFTAVRPASSDTAYIISSRVNGQAYHIMYATLTDTGVLNVGWTQQSDKGDVGVESSVLSAGRVTNVLAIFDAVSGTFTLYIDGSSDGTPVTGISSTESPVLAPTDWHFGVHYDPAGGAVVANTHFDGALDAICLKSLRGMRPASGTTTLTDTLRKHSLHAESCPQAPGVIFNYPLNGDLTDTSRFKNDAAATGVPTYGTAVALPSIPANFVGLVQTPNGRRSNVIGSAGRLFYEDVTDAAA